MSDYIVRGTAAGGQVRVLAATTGGLVERARQIHGTSPVATAALGRLLTAGAMMGSMMKGDGDLLTLQIRCDGPIGGLTVTADSRADVKGYVGNPGVMLPPNGKGKLDVGGAVGHGTLRVMRDLGLKEPYVGQTPLTSGEIAEDLTYYFAASEQIPSSVALGVLMSQDNTVAQAGGFFLQLMPGTEESVIGRLEERIGSIPPVTSMLADGQSPERILRGVVGELGLEILERIPTRFACDCSKARVERAIASIGRKEIQEMVDEGRPVEASCQFCNARYVFSVEDLREILLSSDAINVP